MQGGLHNDAACEELSPISMTDSCLSLSGLSAWPRIRQGGRPTLKDRSWVSSKKAAGLDRIRVGAAMESTPKALVRVSVQRTSRAAECQTDGCEPDEVEEIGRQTSSPVEIISLDISDKTSKVQFVARHRRRQVGMLRSRSWPSLLEFLPSTTESADRIFSPTDSQV
jgi:hypothetical protein